MTSSLKSMLARVGEEKDRARKMRSGLPADGDFLARVRASLELYEDLSSLRYSRLVAELGNEEDARAELRRDAERRRRSEEDMLLRIQVRLYGGNREQEQA
jgi:hypothetical protein